LWYNNTIVKGRYTLLLEVFIKDFYLQKGLIPVSGFSPEEIKNFQEKLNSLSVKDKRRATRKFRKFIRKLEKLKDSSRLGEEISKPEKRNRRRVAHQKIKEISIGRMNEDLSF